MIKIYKYVQFILYIFQGLMQQDFLGFHFSMYLELSAPNFRCTRKTWTQISDVLNILGCSFPMYLLRFLHLGPQPPKKSRTWIFDVGGGTPQKNRCHENEHFQLSMSKSEFPTSQSKFDVLVGNEYIENVAHKKLCHNVFSRDSFLTGAFQT